MGKWIEYKKWQVINGLKYISDYSNPPRKAVFKCYCGNEFITNIYSVKKGLTRSCGCYCKKNHSCLKHGDSKKNYYLYRTWKGIKARCYNIKNPKFKRYGGRGINMYSEWLNDYQKFKSYILSNIGERPNGCTLDRINNDGNYEPKNLRWADAKTQANNRS